MTGGLTFRPYFILIWVGLIDTKFCTYKIFGSPQQCKISSQNLNFEMTNWQVPKVTPVYGR